MIKKDITELSFQEARSFFLKSQSYCSINLPHYFDFTLLLQRFEKKLSKCYSINNGKHVLNEEKTRKTDPNNSKIKLNPCYFPNVNHSIFANKDGLYEWRQFQIINPLVYVALVNEVTEESNWNILKARFEKFKHSDIECYSIPFQNDQGLPATSGDNIDNWWTVIEQRSLKLSMQYEYMLNTDIENCYGSIYTHSIAWAIHDIEVCKENQKKSNKRGKGLWGDRIDNILRWSTYNQTCGIPQGCVLMDFIAELVLGYADFLLAQKIGEFNKNIQSGCLEAKTEIHDYKILRYRDDYRIFTHTKEDASRIAKLLTEVLSVLNFKLNQQKTFITDHIIRDAIKPDKYFRIQSKEYDNSMQKQLLLIHDFSEKHSNSGSIKTMLQHFFERLYTDEFVSDHSDNDVLIAIMLDIMYHNPTSYPIAIPIIGRIVEMKGLVWNNVSSTIKRKLQSLPYTEFLDVWMQRLTIKNKPCEKYEAILCQRVASEVLDCPVMHKENVELWNTEWLQKDFREIIEKTPIVNKQTVEEMTVIPTPEETDVFCNQY